MFGGAAGRKQQHASHERTHLAAMLPTVAAPRCIASPAGRQARAVAGKACRWPCCMPPCWLALQGYSCRHNLPQQGSQLQGQQVV